MLSASDAYQLGYRAALVAGQIVTQELVERLAPGAQLVHQLLKVDETKARESRKRIEAILAANGLQAPPPPPNAAWVDAVRAAGATAVAEGSPAATALEVGAAAGDVTAAARGAYHLLCVPDADRPRLELAGRAAEMTAASGRLAVALALVDGLTGVATKLGPLLAAAPAEARPLAAWLTRLAELLAELGEAFAAPPPTGPPGDEERSLLAQVLARPDDDEPRRRFAELAEKRHDPRAELISLQLTIRDLRRAGATSHGEVKLASRAADIIRAHPGWSDEVLALGLRAVRFRRGFIDQVTVDIDTFLGAAERLFQLAPVLHVVFKEAGGRARELAASAHLGRLHSLVFEDNGLGDDDAEAIAASPHLRGARYLDLARNRLTDAAVAALAASTHLPGLVYCSLRLNRCQDPVDERIDVDETRWEWQATARGLELEREHGPLAWLHPRSPAWPPDVDQI